MDSKCAYINQACCTVCCCFSLGEGADASGVEQQQQISSEEPATKKKKVKRVSWVDESKLCSYFYFQLDETERGQC